MDRFHFDGGFVLFVLLYYVSYMLFLGAGVSTGGVEGVLSSVLVFFFGWPP